MSEEKKQVKIAISSFCLFLYPEQWKSFIQMFKDNLIKSPNERTTEIIKEMIDLLEEVGKEEYITEWDKQNYPIRQKGISEGGW